MTPGWFTRPLELGDTGPDVAVVQRRLGGDPTGVYDEDTQARVRGLQHREGLKETGMVNKATAKKVGERARKGLAPKWFSRTIRLWDEGPDVRAARAAIGVSDDDRWDPDAEAAARRWQSAQGLAPTGELNEEMAIAIAID